MRNEKTFLRLHRNDVSMTMGGGSNGHPLSIHSASIGTRRNARGWKYVSMLLMALFLCIGKMWGVTYYYYIVNAYISDSYSHGQVGITTGKGTASNVNNASTINPSSGTYITTAGWCDSDHDPAILKQSNYSNLMRTTSTTVQVRLLAKPNEGCIFEGWYTNPACTTPPADANQYIKGSGINQGYGGPTDQVFTYQFTLGSDNTTTDGALVINLYAKFTKPAATYKYKSQVSVTSSDFWQGQIAVKYKDNDITPYNQTSTKVAIQYQTTNVEHLTGSVQSESVSDVYYVGALPMRGYRFTNWTVAPGLTISDANSLYPGISVALTADSTKGGDNYIYNKSKLVTANFEADTLIRFKIQKEANQGAVTASFKNYESGSATIADYEYRTVRYEIIDDEKSIIWDCDKAGGGGCHDTAYVIGHHYEPRQATDYDAPALPSMSASETEKWYNNFYSTDRITLTATPAAGYLFSGWYVRQDMKPDSLIPGNNPVLETTLWADSLIFIPMFAPDKSNLDVDGDKDNFLVGLSTCQTFDQALAAAIQGTHKTILQLRNYTVPAGNYTIPEGVTLLIPYDGNQYNPATVLPRLAGNATHSSDNDAYVTLTLDSAAHLEVYGTIEVSGQQAAGASGAGGEEGIGCPTSKYGCLYMGKGSSITLNDGALLRGWGYVLGYKDEKGYQCEIDARRGSRVQEQFQLMDWKGGTWTEKMFYDINSGVNGYKVLPVNQYYIQNVEVPVKYRPGAKLLANSSVYINATVFEVSLNQIFNIDNVGIIGVKYAPGTGLKSDASIFLMDDKDDSEDTWVRKFYDPDTDQQVYEVNNAAYLGSLELNVLNIPVRSTEYKLPITSNFKIHLLYGHMEVTQMTELLPGAEIEINKKATLTQPADSTLYLWDAEDWDHFVSATRESNSHFTFRNGTTVKWRPGGRPTVRRVEKNEANDVALSDAKLIVHGTVDVKGYIKTSAHGASITSTVEDAGTIIFTKPAPTDEEAGNIYQIYNTTGSFSAPAGPGSVYKQVGVTSAQLTNASGDPVYTAGDGIKTDTVSYCFVDINNNGGEWLSLTPVYDKIAKCYPLVQDQFHNYYAKPQEYVKLQSGTEDENTHLYYSEDGSRMFILIPADCQWWEVEAVPNHPELFHCIHPLNDTYYYWDDAWVEKLFQITFKNYDGTTLTYGNDDKDYYELPYGATPQWLSANPTRPADEGYYTYDFAGWKPTPAPVTDDAVYTAQYDRTPVLYAISFNYTKGTKNYTDVTYSQRDSMPVCEHYTLAENEKWDPVLSPVTGPATYSVVAKTSQSDYTIIWKNWDGTTLETDLNVTGMPVYNGDEPTKPILGDTKFTFAGWHPEVQTATEDKVYVALFDEADNDIEVGGTPVTINKDSVVSTVTIHNNGVLTIDNNKKLTVTNLILEADVDPVTPANEASGQLYAANSTQVTVDYAYYDLKLNVAGHHWRAFGVPWQVNIDATPLKEVKTLAGNPSDRTLVLGRDYDIVYYNGAKRASSGAGYWCWELVENHEHVLKPGQGYMIQFVASVGTVRFAKANGAPVIFTGTVELDENGSTGEYNTNNGWNAMSNPMPFHAKMTDGPTVGYVHNGEEIGNDGYVEYDLADRKFLVGKTVYVQAGVGGADVTPVYANGDVYPIVAAAPVRRIEATEKKYMSLRDYYQVAISSTTTEGGHVYVLPEEGKENKYVIGHDLAQFGMSAAIPQVWVNRYDTKLALNTTALFNETAEFPMGVYAPAAGEYTISLNAQPSDEYNVYLTRDGQAIWNLSDGAFTTDLNAGIQSNYGLRLTVNKAPQVVTGVDEAVVDAKGETRKVMINNQVYIIRGENVYTIDGQLVK